MTCVATVGPQVTPVLLPPPSSGIVTCHSDSQGAWLHAGLCADGGGECGKTPAPAPPSRAAQRWPDGAEKI